MSDTFGFKQDKLPLKVFAGSLLPSPPLTTHACSAQLSVDVYVESIRDRSRP